jgi:hypothetical protein
LNLGHIIPFDGARHRELQDLLPWYVTGRLEPEEQARVQAHLSGCPECQAEAELQRRLAPEIGGLPLDVDAGWRRMRQRIEAEQAAPMRARAAALARPLATGWTPWLGWAMAASLLVVVMIARLPSDAPGQYHVLGSRQTAQPGNVMVIFKPETTERQLREILRTDGARLVDGPTAAGAYVLNVAAGERPAALTRLRASGQVLAAEPIDPAPAP